MPHPAHRLNVLRLFRGQTKVIELTIKDQDGRAAKLTTGVEIIATIKASVSDATALVVKKVGAGIDITDADLGKAVLTFDIDDTDLDPKTYSWDVWVEFPGSPKVRQPVVDPSDFVVRAGLANFS